MNWIYWFIAFSAVSVPGYFMLTDVPFSPDTLKSVVTEDPQLQMVQYASGFDRPVDIANAGDGSKRIFIADQYGYVWIIDSAGTVLDTPFLDIDSKVFTQGERGLLGLVFHPEYASNGFFFVNYTNNSSDTRVARYSVDTLNPDRADPNSEKILLAIDQPATNHNGGDMGFSPLDGFLYIASGDGGGVGDPGCYGQDTTTLLGKMLRIDVDQNINTPPYYGIPADNPFAGAIPGLDEIWSYGLRNPWRFAFDKLTGDMWIADVGQGVEEEVNFQPFNSTGGENYGWKVMEGTNCYDPDPIDEDCPDGTLSCDDDGYVDPIFSYTHNPVTGGNSITGGFVYRGCKFPALYGKYIVTDYVSNNGWLVDSLGNHTIFPGMPANIASFGESESGEMFASSLNGNIYRVRDGNIPAILVIDDDDSPLNGTYEASDTIFVSGNITVAPGKTAYLIADHIIIENVFSVDTSSIAQLQRTCNE